MPDDIVIRDLGTDDVEPIIDIAVAAWEPIYAYFRQTMGEELFQAAVPEWQERKARQVRRACDPDDPARVCVAEEEGRIVGFVTFYIDRTSGIGEIGNNAVRPDMRGKGIAPQMYRHALARMKELGMRYAKVCTGGDPSHAPARRAYEKVGFDIRLPGVEYYRPL